MDKIDKILQGGSKVQRNLIVGTMVMCLVGFALVTWAAMTNQIEENAELALGLCAGGSLVSIFTIIYVLHYHRAYRKKLKEKYDALTPKALEQMGMDLQAYREGDLIIFGEKMIYGSFSMLGKAFTKSFTWLSYEDIIWAYEKRETYVLPHYRKNPAIKNSLILRDRFGNGYEIDCHKPYYKEELAKIKNRGEQCIIGYSREKKQTYLNEPHYFYRRYRYTE